MSDLSGGQGVAGSNPVVPTARWGGILCGGCRPICVLTCGYPPGKRSLLDLSLILALGLRQACARTSGANLEHGVEARRNRVRVCSRLLSPLATVGDRWAQSGSDT